MKISRWGNHLAVRLPAEMVEALQLREGDDIELHVEAACRSTVGNTADSRELLERLRKFRGRLPANFKFDRLEHHAR